MNLQSLHVFAATVWGEARGESPEGQAAVAHVILTRAREPGWPDEIVAVCLEPKQFSVWNPDDRNYLKVHAVGFEDPAYLAAFHVISGALVGWIGNAFPGATHYHAMTVQPAWADALPHLGDLGRHRFYREVRA